MPAASQPTGEGSINVDNAPVPHIYNKRDDEYSSFNNNNDNWLQIYTCDIQLPMAISEMTSFVS